MAPRGTVAVLSRPADRTEALVRTGATRALAFNDLGTRTYASEEIHTWVAAAGFDGWKRITLRRLPGYAADATKRKEEYA
jgi:hypothetical protein